MSPDTLSDVLRVVRLSGAVFFNIEASAPWVAEAPPARDVAPYVLPGAQQVIEYHLLVAGNAYASITSEDPVPLHAGDLVMFPQGDPHVISSAPGMHSVVALNALEPCDRLLRRRKAQ